MKPDDADLHADNVMGDTQKYFNKVTSHNSSEKNLTAKVKVVVEVDGESISTSGALKMKKNDVIQISLVDPILGAVELGRMEFTRTRVLIIDRVNKQYVEVPYQEVSFLQKANIDFNTLQSLFWHEVFEPGQTSVSPTNFKIADLGDKVDFVYVDKMLTYQFVTQKSEKILTETNITNPNDKAYQFMFYYDQFEKFQNKLFPRNMKMAFTADGQMTTLALSLSSIKNGADWAARSSAPSKYTKADPEKLFNMLVK